MRKKLTKLQKFIIYAALCEKKSRLIQDARMEGRIDDYRNVIEETQCLIDMLFPHSVGGAKIKLEVS